MNLALSFAEFLKADLTQAHGRAGKQITWL
jgi:hypothetical protein